MKDSREYHEMTWALVLFVAMQVIEGDVARGLVTVALVMVLVRLTQRSVRRWRAKRGRR